MTRGQRAGRSPSMWVQAWRTLRLAWRLLGDRRVSPLLKVLASGLVIAYLLLPIDIAPDLIPILGQIDDLALLILAARLLIEMSPPSVVAEHEFELYESAGSKVDEPSPKDVVEADYRVVE